MPVSSVNSLSSGWNATWYGCGVCRILMVVPSAAFQSKSPLTLLGAVSGVVVATGSDAAGGQQSGRGHRRAAEPHRAEDVAARHPRFAREGVQMSGRVMAGPPVSGRAGD